MAKNVNYRALAADAVRGTSMVGQFSKSDLNTQIREIVREVCGGEWNKGNFMTNRYKVYDIMAEMIPAGIQAVLAGKFDAFADFKDSELGDSTSFQVEDNSLFKVYTTAHGTTDIARQTIHNRSFRVSTTSKMIKIYAEFDAMMKGTIDFAGMVTKVAASFANEIGLMISNAMYGSYSSVGSNFKATGVFDEDTLDDIIANVKAATGATSINIFGDVKALKQISNVFGYSDAAKDAANALGYYATYGDSQLIALPQAYLADKTFAVNRAHLIIVPAGEKIVKVVMEGGAIVVDSEASASNSLQTEYVFGRDIGAAAMTIVDGGYGFYKLS